MSWTTKALTCREMWGINVRHLALALAADLRNTRCEAFLRAQTLSSVDLLALSVLSVVLLGWLHNREWLTSLSLFSCHPPHVCKENIQGTVTSRSHTFGDPSPGLGDEIIYRSVCMFSFCCKFLTENWSRCHCSVESFVEKQIQGLLGWTPSPEIRASGIE